VVNSLPFTQSVRLLWTFLGAVYSQEEACHEIADFSDGSLYDGNEGYDGGEADEGFHG